MALGRLLVEAIEAASGGMILNIFHKLFSSGDGDKSGDGDTEKISRVRQAIVQSGILPFFFTKEDEAKLIARFGIIQNGLTVEEMSTLSKFLANKCNSRERSSFRCSIALIERVDNIIKVVYEDKAKQKSRTVEKVEVADAGLDFLKKLSDPTLSPAKRYTICKGLGLFDFSNSVQNAWEKADKALQAAGTTLDSLKQTMESAMLPKPAPAGSSRTTRLFYWFKNL